MQEQEYKVVSVKQSGVWKSPYGEMIGYSLALEGMSEPVLLNKKMPVSREPEVGDTLYGVVEEKTNAKGNAYNKFTAKPRPDTPQGSTAGVSHETNWGDRDRAITTSWAIGKAVDWVAASTGEVSAIEPFAKTLLELHEKLKNPDLANVKEVLSVTEEPINMDDIPY